MKSLFACQIVVFFYPPVCLSAGAAEAHVCVCVCMCGCVCVWQGVRGVHNVYNGLTLQNGSNVTLEQFG